MHLTDLKRHVAPVLALGVLAAALAAPALARDLPKHPDELTFKPFKFDAPEAKKHRIELDNGMVAYLVPDQTTPLVTISAVLRVGSDLDPQGKEGIAEMTMHLLTRSGTVQRTAKEIEDRVGFLGAELGSGLSASGGFLGSGTAPNAPHASISLLSKDADEGLALLVECLKSPAWETDRIDLYKDEALQAMKARNDQTQNIEAREWGFLVYGDAHWSNRYDTKASIEAISAADLADFHKRYIGPQNFTLAVSGDFDRKEMTKKLKRAFADWSYAAKRPANPPAPTQPAATGYFLVDKDVNQGRVSIGLPAIDQYDPDWFSATMMNMVLGGGSFGSRLVDRIRSDEGLAYSVRSTFEGGTYYKGPWRLMFQSKVRSVAYAIEVAMAEIDKVRAEGVTQEELDVAKNQFIEGFPAAFETATAIANQMAMMESNGRYAKDPKFLQEFRKRVAAVTVDDCKRVANRLLDPSKMAILMVGNAEDILLGDPKHDASIKAMAGGEPTRLPLRDPMTMEPMANP